MRWNFVLDWIDLNSTKSIQDLTWECGCYFANAPPNTTPNSQTHYVNAVINQIRSQPYITPLVQKCYQVIICFKCLRMVGGKRGIIILITSCAYMPFLVWLLRIIFHENNTLRHIVLFYLGNLARSWFKFFRTAVVMS